MLDAGGPVVLGDTEAGVGRLHVTTVIGARPACGLAQEVYDVTANLLQRFRAVADEEALELRSLARRAMKSSVTAANAS